MHCSVQIYRQAAHLCIGVRLKLNTNKRLVTALVYDLGSALHWCTIKAHLCIGVRLGLNTDRWAILALVYEGLNADGSSLHTDGLSQEKSLPVCFEEAEVI